MLDSLSNMKISFDANVVNWEVIDYQFSGFYKDHMYLLLYQENDHWELLQPVLFGQTVNTAIDRARDQNVNIYDHFADVRIKRRSLFYTIFLIFQLFWCICYLDSHSSHLWILERRCRMQSHFCSLRLSLLEHVFS